MTVELQTGEPAEPAPASLPGLNRTSRPAAKAPVRIVHLGLGAFHRSHQAWYTQQAGDAAGWGIASFTGRRPDAALALAGQDGLYTVVERADAGDSFEVVSSIVEAVDGANVDRLAELVAAPATAVITLTITEAAYGLNAHGQLDRTAPGVVADLALLAAGAADAGRPKTPLGRLVFALAARKAAGAGPLAVVCCDNLANNGTVARNAVLGLAAAWDARLAAWVDANVSFVSTSVDRITPRTTEADVAAVQAACGFSDNSPVVAEPFRNWVLSGDFPAGRPRWEDAGAVFVDEIEPYENRKLWLLNGAHSLLAYAGQLRGHATVAAALADPGCLQAVEEFWDEAAANLATADRQRAELRIPEYRAQLLARFRNARIAHHLAQIAVDGSTKLRMRAVPVLQAERATGRTGGAAARLIAAWMDYTRLDFPGAAPQLADPLAAEIRVANSLSGTRRIATLLGLLSPGLGEDAAVVSLIENLCGTLTEPAVSE
ncbi:fructuronate reductase [Arthrobacter sp. V4I6]|uniref:mannitol dehydrogenase family protein n=1 Tax=unclassified Arthrobacter TaxID=235627 RepID=UPI002788A50D|nr:MULTISPECIES: mannitol dehydrogenase family protein [unclassified Arthrobacter]MDQ0820793.1 fructuronate reductase [Arthrobacter sp. V1I7]MDQ0855055.1 fructuronate reductase [Arthrobacter sp. V4I6]